MANTNIVFGLLELSAITSEMASMGEALRVEKKEITGFSGKSEVLDKYVELYKMLCEAIEEYCDLVKHDVESINGVCRRILDADKFAGWTIKNFPLGGVSNVLPD
jgi:hypothetical protein